MKRYLVLLLLCFCTFSCAQKLELEKASPFTAVKWKGDIPIVKFEDTWYRLHELENRNVNDIIDFCKENYKNKWKKRFSEDLIEVLKKMNIQPKVTVKLVLYSKEAIKKEVVGTYTLKNRYKVFLYNNRKEPLTIKEIPKEKAIEDIIEFQNILEERSSYIHLSNFDYRKAISQLKTQITTRKTAITINFLTHELAKIMAEIGDRHSYVKNENIDKNNIPNYNLQLPFTIAPLAGKIVALKRVEKADTYNYLCAKYPYVKSINNVSIYKMIEALAYRSKKAPKDAKLSRGVAEIQQFGRLHFKNNIKLPKKIAIVFTNGTIDTTATIQLENKQHKYYNKLLKQTKQNTADIVNGNFRSMATLLKDSIGYIKIPEMFHPEDVTGLDNFFREKLKEFATTKALIIDIRNNPGGGREILQTFASYIVQPAQSPWVANVAYLRSDVKNVNESSMTGRYLYKYDSEQLTDLERKAIDNFNQTFKTAKTFTADKFNGPFYMVLHSGKISYTKPIYILVNERSFSAATVFTSAFKGLPNVKIVGVTTDGSSGNSKKIYLKYSNIKVKVSTMLSFQRNGKTLDRKGTQPDIEIKTNEKQVLYGEDYQLNALIKRINSKN